MRFKNENQAPPLSLSKARHPRVGVNLSIKPLMTVKLMVSFALFFSSYLIQQPLSLPTVVKREKLKPVVLPRDRLL